MRFLQTSGSNDAVPYIVLPNQSHRPAVPHTPNMPPTWNNTTATKADLVVGTIAFVAVISGYAVHLSRRRVVTAQPQPSANTSPTNTTAHVVVTVPVLSEQGEMRRLS
jgi:hypothetical protein